MERFIHLETIIRFLAVLFFHGDFRYEKANGERGNARILFDVETPENHLSSRCRKFSLVQNNSLLSECVQSRRGSINNSSNI